MLKVSASCSEKCYKYKIKNREQRLQHSRKGQAISEIEHQRPIRIRQLEFQFCDPKVKMSALLVLQNYPAN